MRNSCLCTRGGILRVYLEDVWSWLFHDMCQAEQVKQGFSHEPFPLAVASQGFTDLRLVCFACYLRGQTSISLYI